MPTKKQQPPAIAPVQAAEPTPNGKQPLVVKPVPTPHEESILVPFKKARELLGGICADTLYDLINAGELESLKVASRRLVVRASLYAYITREVEKDQQLRAGGRV